SRSSSGPASHEVWPEPVEPLPTVTAIVEAASPPPSPTGTPPPPWLPPSLPPAPGLERPVLPAELAPLQAAIRPARATAEVVRTRCFMGVLQAKDGGRTGRSAGGVAA